MFCDRRDVFAIHRRVSRADRTRSIRFFVNKYFKKTASPIERCAQINQQNLQRKNPQENVLAFRDLDQERTIGLASSFRDARVDDQPGSERTTDPRRARETTVDGARCSRTRHSSQRGSSSRSSVARRKDRKSINKNLQSKNPQENVLAFRDLDQERTIGLASSFRDAGLTINSRTERDRCQERRGQRTRVERARRPSMERGVLEHDTARKGAARHDRASRAHVGASRRATQHVRVVRRARETARARWSPVRERTRDPSPPRVASSMERGVLESATTSDGAGSFSRASPGPRGRRVRRGRRPRFAVAPRARATWCSRSPAITTRTKMAVSDTTKHAVRARAGRARLVRDLR